MNNQQELINQLNDIKDIVDIKEYSLYIFIILVIIIAVILVYIIYLIYIKIKTKKTNYNKIYIKKLKNIKLDNTSIKNTKKLAYEITYYINKISLDKNSIDIKNQLLENLDNYKYKKEIIKLDQNTRILYKKILENI